KTRGSDKLFFEFFWLALFKFLSCTGHTFGAASRRRLIRRRQYHEMKKLKYQPLLLLVLGLMLGVAGVWLFAYCRAKQKRERRPVVSFAPAKPVLEANPGELPAALKEPNEGNWKSWAQHEDNVVRTRLEQGALDSMVNLLLFGTSFTTQPRIITMNDFGDPAVQARVTDLVKALSNPGNNERIIFL